MVPAVELAERLCAASCARKGEVKIVQVEALEGRRFTVRRHMLEERLPIDSDPRVGRTSGIDQAPSLLLEIRHRRIVG